VLEEIRRRHAEGHPMHYGGVRSSYEAPLQQAKKHFKSRDAARAAAGKWGGCRENGSTPSGERRSSSRRI